MPERPRPRFNPVIAALPVVVVFVLTAVPGNNPVSSAFGTRDTTVREALVARIQQQMTAVPEVRNASPAPSATPPASESRSASPASPAVTVATAVPATCDPVPGERYCKYVVQPGDSLASLATRFNLNGGAVPGWELLWASNREVLAGVDDVLAVGQTLRIPTRPGVLHTVFPGESLMALAVAYDVASEDIADDNGLDLDVILVAGQVLLIASPPVIPETPVLPHEADDEPQSREDEEQNAESTPTVAPDEDPEATPRPDDPEEGDDEEEEEDEPAPAPDDPTHMSWPIVQPIRVTNYMSARHPLGMDFGLSHAKGSNITAAADGVVAFAGGDACCSYGYYVIIEHSNGLKTLYAHLSKINVKKGQTVKRGEALGVAGSTGYSTGTHLHFEVYLNGKRVNPMNYLPD